MTAAPDVVSLIDWHFRQATSPTSEGEDDRRSDHETDPHDGSDVTAARA